MQTPEIHTQGLKKNHMYLLVLPYSAVAVRLLTGFRKVCPGRHSETSVERMPEQSLGIFQFQHKLKQSWVQRVKLSSMWEFRILCTSIQDYAQHQKKKFFRRMTSWWQLAYNKEKIIWEITITYTREAVREIRVVRGTQGRCRPEADRQTPVCQVRPKPQQINWLYRSWVLKHPQGLKAKLPWKV